MTFLPSNVKDNLSIDHLFFSYFFQKYTILNFFFADLHSKLYCFTPIHHCVVIKWRFYPYDVSKVITVSKQKWKNEKKYNFRWIPAKKKNCVFLKNSEKTGGRWIISLFQNINFPHVKRVRAITFIFDLKLIISLIYLQIRVK